MRHAWVVHPATDQRIIDVGHRHQPGADGNGISGQTLRVAAAVPLLLMAVGNLLGQTQKVHRDAELILGPLDGITPQGGVGHHDLELFHR
ncbi:hypothetical protein D3C85_1556530 [compost metagenome]